MADKKIDIHETGSRKKGLMGVLETFMRTFKIPFFIILLISFLIIYVACIATALTPTVLLFQYIQDCVAQSNSLVKAFFTAASIGVGFYLYGVMLILVVPIFNLTVVRFVKPFKGNWYSLEVIPWYIHNAFTYLVRYTFLDFCTPSPFVQLFYRLMGMKMGKNCMINTSNISDPCLIELGDYVTIGGSATLMAHYGQKGILILSKTKIGSKSTIGLKASVFGGVEIGERVLVPPHEVVFPKTLLPDGYRFEKN